MIKVSLIEHGNTYHSYATYSDFFWAIRNGSRFKIEIEKDLLFTNPLLNSQC